MRARTLSTLFFLFVGMVTASARITAAWTYQEMFDRSDVVVIAYKLSTKDTDERTTLNDLEPHVSVIGVVSREICRSSFSITIVSHQNTISWQRTALILFAFQGDIYLF